MSKKEVVNLQINKEKFEEINKLIEEEAEQRANAKIKGFVSKLVFAGTVAGIVIGTPFAAIDAGRRENEYLESKTKQEQEYLNGERNTISDEEAFINGYEDEESFVVKGDGWTGNYRSR